MISSIKDMPAILQCRSHLAKSAMIAVPFLFVMLLLPTMINSFDAYGQVLTDCNTGQVADINSNYNGPIVLDAFWVDQGSTSVVSSGNVTQNNNPTKKEVGPGEGASILAVVLNNKSPQILTSITGFLNLPGGFTPTGESKNPQVMAQYIPNTRVTGNPALASYFSNVQPGETFTLFFNVDILNTAKTGTYSAGLVVNYNLGNQLATCSSALLDVPVVLPGKVILDAVSDTYNISPQKVDPITITIFNRGSADATGVVATIANLGNTKGGSSSGSGGSLVLQSSTTQLVNLGSNMFNIGTIPANGSAQISTSIYPSSSASGTTQDVQLQLTYENAWGKQESTTVNTALVISPTPPQSLNLAYLGNNTSPTITSGNLDDLNFAVANNSPEEVSNVVISLVPQSSSVSIVGQSTWAIEKMSPGDKQTLSTKVFAANTLINTPTSFTLTANYISQGQTQSNSLTLGAFVVGDIKLQLYDLSVNVVGNTPNLAGSLLNQGSTTGLFTTIQLTKSPLLEAIREARLANSTFNNTNIHNASSFQQAQAASGSPPPTRSRTFSPQQQFLGDLTPDSPIPFSIPLNGINSLQPGMYPVSFKVNYADDLKVFHQTILNGTVNVVKIQPRGNGNNQQSILDQIPLPLPVLMGIAIAVIAAASVIIGRKKSSNKRLKALTGSATDIVAVLDSSDKGQNES